MGFLSMNKITGNVVPVAEDHRFNDTGSMSVTEPHENVKGALPSVRSHTSDNGSERVSEDMQQGVQRAQAVTVVWSKWSLILAYAIIFVLYFVDSLESQILNVFTPYVTSSFQQHSLTATTSVISGIIGGLSKLPLAKVLDVWGRPQGFALMVFISAIGLIMMAATNNVQTYCAAQVFYWVGQNGVGYSLSIFIADTSSLRNRSLMFGFAFSPYIVTTWVGGPAAQSFLSGAGWRWGFGTFAIVTPVMAMPLLALFIWNYRKAKAAGVMPVRTISNRTILQSLRHYAIEFDLFGLVLIAGGLALFLLPFSIYSYQTLGWRSPTILCMLIFGILLLVAFAVYERSYAPKTFMPWNLLSDRMVLGANILAAVLFFSFYLWNSYFYSFLIVVNNLTVTQANYIVNIYSIGSCTWAIVSGIAIRKVGKFKGFALYFGVPVMFLGVGLMINFRQPDVNIGYIVMCQIFIAVSGGTLVICEQMAVMAATSQQYVAVVLAVEGMFASVGGAIGSTVATAIWTGTFPQALARYLPESAQGDLASIYGDLEVQTSYPVGSLERDAINRAYGDAQRYMLIPSIAILSIAVVAVIAWRDINVKNFKQVKGTVV